MHQVCGELFEGLRLNLFVIKVDISNAVIWRKKLLNMIDNEGPIASNQFGEWT